MTGRPVDWLCPDVANTVFNDVIRDRLFIRRDGDRSSNVSTGIDIFCGRFGVCRYINESNLLRDRARSAIRWRKCPSLPIDVVLRKEGEPKAVEDIGAERVLIARERLSEVLASLDELGERTKSVFILFHGKPWIAMRAYTHACCFTPVRIRQQVPPRAALRRGWSRMAWPKRTNEC